MVELLELLVPIFLFPASLIGIWYAWQLMKKQNAFLRKATVTKAKVIQGRTLYYDKDGEGCYQSPILQFRDHRGQFVKIQTSQQFDVWQPGEEVTIIFDKNSPNNAQVVSYWSLYAMPTIIGAISGSLFVNSAGTLITNLL